jgi:Tol biopolymer transport system component
MQARTFVPKSNHALWLFALAAVGIVGLATAAVVRFGPLSGSPAARDGALKTGLAYFAFDDTADTLYIADPDQPAHRSKVFVAPHASEYGVVPSLSPDSKRIAYTSLPVDTVAPSPETPAGLWLKSLSDTDAPKLIARDVDLLVHPAWSPDSANVVYRRSQDSNGALFVLNVVTSGGRDLVSSDKAGLFPIGFSRDGANLYYTTVLTDGSDLYSIPLAGGTPRLVAHLADSLTRDWALSPDKTKLAYLQVSFDGGLAASKALLADLTTGTTTPVTDEQDDAFSPTWGADGRLVVGTLGEKGAAVVTLNGPRIESPASGFDVPLLVRDQGIVVQGFTGASASNPGDSTLTYIAADGSRRPIATGEVTFLGWVAP